MGPLMCRHFEHLFLQSQKVPSLRRPGNGQLEVPAICLDALLDWVSLPELQRQFARCAGTTASAVPAGSPHAASSCCARPPSMNSSSEGLMCGHSAALKIPEM